MFSLLNRFQFKYTKRFADNLISRKWSIDMSFCNFNMFFFCVRLLSSHFLCWTFLGKVHSTYNTMIESGTRKQLESISMLEKRPNYICLCLIILYKRSLNNILLNITKWFTNIHYVFERTYQFVLLKLIHINDLY